MNWWIRHRPALARDGNKAGEVLVAVEGEERLRIVPWQVANEQNLAWAPCPDPFEAGPLDRLGVMKRDVKCPHGDDPSECNACMVDSDIAFDMAREGRIFGRGK